MKIMLSAPEAAAELGVSTATLYAYVSRGMIRSEPQPGSRRKLYRAEDVRALAARHPGSDTAAPVPLLDTAITLIDRGRLCYRGHDVEQLARDTRFETVASLLWQSGDDDAFAHPYEPQLPPAPAPLAGRMIAGLIAAADCDRLAFSRAPDALARCAARITRQLAASAIGKRVEAPLHQALAAGWARPQAADIIRTGLVVLADHELATSTLAVRVAASTGASPWRAITAGLACLDGPRHGGMGERVARFLDLLAPSADIERDFAAFLATGEDAPGFGLAFYPQGDPRARALFRALASLPRSPQIVHAEAIAAIGETLTGRRPNIDFALTTACSAAGLPREAPLALFAIARSVGWMAHVMEQAQSPDLLRFRARYVGALPA